jgi:hypothetical protein
VGASANGLPTAVFSSTSVMQWALAANNNNATKLGLACFIKPTDVVGNKFLAAITLTPGGASANKWRAFVAANQLRCDDDITGRHAVSGTVDTAWHFVTFEVDCSQGTEATQVIQSMDAVTQTVSFSSDTAWGANLGTPTGNMLIGATSAAGGSPFLGSYGPNFYWLNRQLTAAERSLLSSFEVPT